MTVAELIIELRKYDQSDEVWIDTEQGLMCTEHVYGYKHDELGTVIITFKDNDYTKPESIN